MKFLGKFGLFLVSLLLLLQHGNCTINLLGEIIQNNIVGVPVLHREQTWIFDPDEGLKRSAHYQQINGFRGEKLIEKLGLGIDGNQERRLLEQRRRDEGHLGGLNFYNP